MYSRAQVLRGLRRTATHPPFLAREVNRLYHRRGYRRPYNTDGVDVVAEAWDNLVILDACRYDDFAAVADLPGTLSKRESPGSHTREFLRGAFGGRDLLDTAYVTASPQFHRHRDAVDARLHAVENVWDGPGWDDDAGTVRPSAMADHALAAHGRYPDKRLVVHFLQPHYPFLADDDLNRRGIDGEGLDVWGELFRGESTATPGEVRAAYRRNLELVLPAVRTLLAELPGRTVVTADHGNMFGERARPVPIREWGHPPGIHTPELVEVPWHVSENGDKRVRAAPPVEAESEGASDPTDRLRDLGYVE